MSVIPPLGEDPEVPRLRRLVTVFAGLSICLGLTVVALAIVLVVQSEKAPASSGTDPSGFAGTGSTGTGNTGSSAPQRLSIGQPEQLATGNNASWGTVIVQSVSVASNLQGTAPQAGHFVTFRVRYVAGDHISQDFPVDVGAFTVVEGNGNTFDVQSGHGWIVTPAPALYDAPDLSSGESTVGYITFDVPKVHGELVFAPNEGSAPLAEWSF